MPEYTDLCLTFLRSTFFLFHDVCILGAVCYCFLFCHYYQDIQYGVINSK